MNLKKLKKINPYRKPLHWLVVILLGVMVLRMFYSRDYVADIEAYCPFGGLQSLGSFLINGSLACAMSMTQIAMGIALFIGILIFSKLFCSFVCPLGIFSEWLGKWGSRFKLRYTIKGWPDRLLRIFKYALLFATFYYTLSSSELFCKKFDPYYAFFSGFNNDVDLTYALISIIILFAGAFFLRLAWCKYFCPLGALSNIFTYSIISIPLGLLYFVLTLVTPLAFSWIIILLILCVAGFFAEALLMKFTLFPIFRVTRNTDTCTNCRLCDKACPVAIKVSELTDVRHVDCHFCGDCVHACPEKDTLLINKRKKLRWTAPVGVVVLFAAALLYASHYELPTISEFWGSDAALEKAEVFTIEGLTTVRCYGSSKSLALHLREIDGILGIETFAKQFKVDIYFDPQRLTHDQVGMLLFTPSVNLIRSPDDFSKQVGVWEVKVDRYFDDADAYLMQELMKQTTGVYAYKISYGEPAPATYYFDIDATNPENIRLAIAQKELIIEEEGATTTETLQFEPKDYASTYTTISAASFFSTFIPVFEYSFNKAADFAPEAIDTLTLSVNGLPSAQLNDDLLYLMSHVSAHKPIIHMHTAYTSEGIILKTAFVSQATDAQTVEKWLRSPTLKIMYDDGTFEEMVNPVIFSTVNK